MSDASFESAASESFLKCHGGDTFCDDRYTLIESIATGHYGTVWKASDATSDKTVVAKFARAGKNYDDVWQVEAAVLNAMHACPNILTLYDTFSHDGAGGRHTCLVFDYIPSGDLFSWIHDDDAYKTADVETCKSIAAQIFEGLHALHETTPGWSVVHADLKPENVLVDTRVRPPHAMIADLGSASVLRGDVNGRRKWIRNHGHTMEYRSPEGVCGGQLSVKSDIWSAGVILYELFTGCSLFDPPCHRHGSTEGSDEGGSEEEVSGAEVSEEEVSEAEEDDDDEEEDYDPDNDPDNDGRRPGRRNGSLAVDDAQMAAFFVMRETLDPSSAPLRATTRHVHELGQHQA